MHGLAVYVREGLPFPQDISIKNSADSYLHFLLVFLPSVSVFLSQITLLRWLAFLLGSLTLILTVLLFSIYFFLLTLVFLLMAFPPLGNSDHVIVSVSIDFQINSKRDALFHCITYDYSRADWDGLCDHLRDIPWEDIFKLSASGATSGFCEWVQVKYQVKPHSSPWFSAACAAAIVHRNYLFSIVPAE